MLLMPAAGIIKQSYPDSRLIFLGRSYQRAIIESCRHFDDFIDWDEIRHLPATEQAQILAAQHIDVFVSVKPRRPIVTAARMAKIPHRIGSVDRLFHLFQCNHIPFVWRQRSKFHEAQTNIRLLSSILNKTDYSLQELHPFLGLDTPKTQPPQIEKALSKRKFNLILHPLSNGHAKEWPIENYLSLIHLLPTEKYNIIITGTEKEGEHLRDTLLVPLKERIVDLTGKISICDLPGLIARADGLIAASTGPLHIAAAAGINTLGLYVQRWQLRPERYGPIGKHTSVLVHDPHCPTCLANKDCDCINLISPERVKNHIRNWIKGY